MLRFIYGLITGLLMSVSIYLMVFSSFRYIDERDRNKFKVNADLNSINLAIKFYYNDMRTLPSNEEGLEKLSPKYIEELLPDPWGKKYLYTAFRFHEKSCYVVWSFGSDLKSGGKDEAEDIFSMGENGNCF